jgi:hypothetical protein
MKSTSEPPIRKTSRLTTMMVIQRGMASRMVRLTKAAVTSSLSATGSNTMPRSDF